MVPEEKKHQSVLIAILALTPLISIPKSLSLKLASNTGLYRYICLYQLFRSQNRKVLNIQYLAGHILNFQIILNWHSIFRPGRPNLQFPKATAFTDTKSWTFNIWSAKSWISKYWTINIWQTNFKQSIFFRSHREFPNVEFPIFLTDLILNFQLHIYTQQAN